ncbi:hypothetical protein CAPTEDRAFT_195728 [Capitella teleta]|uniref:Uncharacterized protein n=1 Tax=Capitella teleta TaxID=283909 RepID=X1ZVF4_CAPTE|nr:hypothetical protein CAPTEDRAFT_195728 [Capitella teleta]|eukprot:ELT88436.1 hypothetical protein CAPTEDRAFT_195728 [Capitella teleta]
MVELTFHCSLLAEYSYSGTAAAPQSGGYGGAGYGGSGYGQAQAPGQGQSSGGYSQSSAGYGQPPPAQQPPPAGGSGGSGYGQNFGYDQSAQSQYGSQASSTNGSQTQSSSSSYGYVKPTYGVVTLEPVWVILLLFSSAVEPHKLCKLFVVQSECLA